MHQQHSDSRSPSVAASEDALKVIRSAEMEAFPPTGRKEISFSEGRKFSKSFIYLAERVGARSAERKLCVENIYNFANSDDFGVSVGNSRLSPRVRVTVGV